MGKTEKVCFWTTGADLTRLFRGFVLDGDWTRAVEGMIEGLVGVSYDLVFRILKGEMRLNGDSRGEPFIGVEPDSVDNEETARYVMDMNFIYGAVWVAPDGFSYRPYAEVTNWGENDLASIRQSLYEACDESEWRRDRSKHYMSDRARDIITFERLPDGYRNGPAAYHSHVLWRACGIVPPFWMPKHRTSKAAIDDAVRIGFRLEERGHLQSYGEVDPMDATSKDEHDAAVAALERYRDPDVEAEIAERVTDDQRKATEEVMVRLLKDKIREQAKICGWLDLVVGDVSYRIPAAPFLKYALGRTSGRSLAPGWDPVSPSGYKMYGDDRYHSDWMLGAVPDLDSFAMYGGIDQSAEERAFTDALQSAVYNKVNELQHDMLGFECAVLSGSGRVASTIYDLRELKKDWSNRIPAGAILLTKNLSMQAYEEVVDRLSGDFDTLGGIICEVGGAMAHMVTVGRESNMRIVRVANALSIYQHNMPVQIDCDRGTVRIKGEFSF